jgi:hypothetical protein
MWAKLTLTQSIVNPDGLFARLARRSSAAPAIFLDLGKPRRE